MKLASSRVQKVTSEIKLVRLTRFQALNGTKDVESNLSRHFNLQMQLNNLICQCCSVIAWAETTNGGLPSTGDINTLTTSKMNFLVGVA